MRRLLLTLIIPALFLASGLAIGNPQRAQASAPAAQAQAVAARTFGWCDGKDPAAFNSGHINTARAKTQFGRLIELRFDTTNRCAWGKISNGSVGDQIWVDRSFDHGRTWQPQLGFTTIQSGRDTHTREYDDAGVVMRACGKAGNRAQIACTDPWY